jgi:molybdopterin-containing oxidoreductase family membrane subunit
MANGFSLATTMDPEAGRPGINVMTGLFGLLMVAGVAIGLYGFFVGHEHVYNTTREIPWGLIIAAYAFFAITSTGLCLLAAISHAFGGNKIAPLANRMVWLSLITIISGFMAIGMEIENPWRMAIWNVISPNPTSNIWWMGTLYGMAVGFMILEFWLILNRHYKLSLALGILGALAETAANSCLGGVFATLPAHPYWYGGQLPMYFLACAFTSGAAATVFFTHLAFVIRGKRMDQDVFVAVQSAAKVLVLMLILVSVATFWKMISFFVGGQIAGLEAAKTLLSGPLSTNFWFFEIAIGLALPLALMIVTRLKSLIAMSAAALMTLIGMFVSRMDMVIAGQLVPHYVGFEDTPTLLTYVPSGYEWMVVLGSIGFCGMAFLLGERFFGKKFAEHATH